MKNVFVTGGTGYIGKRLVKHLMKRGHHVTVLVRKGSEKKVPQGASIIIADPFNAASFKNDIPQAAVFIQLLGTPHPSPKKANQFREIDLKSVITSADAATSAGAMHFIYVSVAMAPSKLMGAYQDVRKKGEQYLLDKNLACTFLRPWYVVGPGHWWPVLLLPFYGLAELIPSWRIRARKKALVTIGQMLNALMNAVEKNFHETEIMEIRDIRKSRPLK